MDNSLITGTWGPTVDRGSPNLQITSTPSSPVVGGTYQVTTSSNDPEGAIHLSINSSTAANCTIDGSGLVTFVKHLKCLIDADQDSSADWNAASTSQSVTPGLGTPNLQITSTPSSPVVGGTYQVTTSSNDPEGAIHLSINSSTATNCTIDGSGLVTFVKHLECLIDADQEFQRRLERGLHQPVGDARSWHAEPADHLYPRQPGRGRHLSGDHLKQREPGGDPPLDRCIHCSQLHHRRQRPGHLREAPRVPDRRRSNSSADWNAASTSQSVTPGLGTPNLQITSTPSSPVVGGTYQVTTSSNDPEGAIHVTIDPGSTGCTIDGSNVVHFQNTSDCVIDASQDSSADWNSGSTSQTVHVGKGTPNIGFTSTDPGAAVGLTYSPTTSTNDSENPVALHDRRHHGQCLLYRRQQRGPLPDDGHLQDRRPSGLEHQLERGLGPAIGCR